MGDNTPIASIQETKARTIDSLSGVKSQVLAVDDDMTNLILVEELLGFGFDVTTATSGARALEIVEAVQPDVVLLDILMPGIDGYETCRRLRLNPKLAPPKIIMVSAADSAEERALGLAAGADDYITKPFNAMNLLEIIRANCQ